MMLEIGDKNVSKKVTPLNNFVFIVFIVKANKQNRKKQNKK